MDTVYWVWLQQALGYGFKKIDTVIQYFESPEKLYLASESDKRFSGIFTPKELNMLLTTPLSVAEKIISINQKLKCSIITPTNETYPQRLLTCPDYPAVLYVKGDIGDINDSITIAMVGSRETSEYGRKVAFKLSSVLAECGVIIVSGCAYGIDTCSHEGALAGKGKTIAVLGCGLDINYPERNSKLKTCISNNGAVITEYAPGEIAKAWNFPIRNRIISGMSHGVVVVEAAEKSGSLITATLASEQGRDVFAVLGSIASRNSKGTNKLIKDGAKAVTSAEDIIEEYYYIIKQKIDFQKLKDESVNPFLDSNYDETPEQNHKKIKAKTSSETKQKSLEQKANELTKIENSVLDKERIQQEQSLNDEQKEVLRVIKSCIKGVLSDEICEKTGFSPPKVMSVLTMLELKGIITSNPGKRYTY